LPARWDALAPFNDTAKPILPESTLPRWPAEQRTNTNMNTVWLYTLLRVAEWYLPAAVSGLQSIMAKYKLDHREVSKDPTTMAGAGNFVADVWVKFGQQVREHLALLLCPLFSLTKWHL
jgi:hypothetical protein